MLLYQKIEFILLHLDFVDSHFDELTPISRRMYATGLAKELNQLVSELREIDEQIESSLDYEDAYLDASIFENGIKFSKLCNESLYREDIGNDSEINKMIDIFPLNKENYSFTSDNAEKFKTAMRYLCNDANLSSRDYVYAIYNGLTSLASLLISISHKKSKIKDNQYEEFWYALTSRDDDYFPELSYNDYEKWKEEHDYQDIQVLKDKRTQEIFKILNSGIFNYDIKPVKRDINNSLINISEEALEEGTALPENLATECARFSRYVTFKNNILCINYTKLGKYVYKHFREIEDKQIDRLIYFDYLLMLIHNDMAECNPNLKKYLKFYDDDKLEETFNKALQIIKCCNSLLKEEVQDDFLKSYLHDAFYGDNQLKVRNDLQGQSKYTVICYMLGMIKSTRKVFRIDVTSADIAKELATVIKKPKEDSLKRYIDKGASDLQSKLSKWTVQYITEKLGSKSERLFMDIANK